MSDTFTLKKIEKEGFTCEIVADVGKNNKIDCLEFCVYDDGALIGFERHYFGKLVSYKGKIVKEFLNSKKADRAANRALLEAKTLIYAKAIKAMAPPTGYKYTSEFHVMRNAGFYKTSSNNSYQPGLINCANISIDFDGSCWLQLTDGYVKGSISRFDSVENAVAHAENLLGQALSAA